MMRAHGVATCNPMGEEGKWLPEIPETLMGLRACVIVADRDDTGIKHALAVRDSLLGVGVEADVRVARTGKDVSDHLAAGHTLDELVPYEEVPPADLAVTLDDVKAFVRRFVVLNEAQLTAVALWVFHTHAVEAAYTTPYLAITSALKRSGKSRLLVEVLPLLEPMPIVSISDAVLFRAIDKLEPTLLFDEIDAIFGPKARDREDLRGMVNSGYRRGVNAMRMGGGNMTTLQKFKVFCPKAFGGIGDLPDTIADRSIQIRLERRTPDELIEPFYQREASEQAEPLRESIESLAEFHTPALADARPSYLPVWTTALRTFGIRCSR